MEFNPQNDDCCFIEEIKPPLSSRSSSSSSSSSTRSSDEIIIIEHSLPLEKEEEDISIVAVVPRRSEIGSGLSISLDDFQKSEEEDFRELLAILDMQKMRNKESLKRKYAEIEPTPSYTPSHCRNSNTSEGESSSGSVTLSRKTVSESHLRGGRSLMETTSSLPMRNGQAPQLREIRKIRRDQYNSTRQSSNRTFTLKDLKEKKEKEKDQQMRGYWEEKENESRPRIQTLSSLLSSPASCLSIGQKALQLTNDFRKSKGLSPLEWSQPLYTIGEEHSRDMGEGRVEFGHGGFAERSRKTPIRARGFAENVAYNQGFDDVAKTAVDGWIASPGHCKNMVGRYQWCGIGVYRNASGVYYLTQLFAST